MSNTKFDNNPKYQGVVNFASNTKPDLKDMTQTMIEAFNYGFRMGWQTHWYEVEKLEKKK